MIDQRFRSLLSISLMLLCVPLASCGGDNVPPDVGVDSSSGDGMVANECGGAGLLAGSPGERCGCGGHWVCEGEETVICIDDFSNECGGCESVEGSVGAECGPCGGGVYECDGLDAMICVGGGIGSPGDLCGGACGTGRLTCNAHQALVCVGEGVNACGGCETLSQLPGEACNSCGGRFVCHGTDVLACAGSGVNVCGGCAELTGEPGDSCGGCPGAVQRCESEDELSCVETRNACGGCAPLPTDLGDACGRCGTWMCAGVDGLSCDDPALCPVGAECAGDAECSTNRCSNEVCVPPGFSFIPAGTFTMGAPPSERGFHSSRENGEHTAVLTRSYLAMATEVTQAEWFDLTGTRPSYFTECGDECPVERVNWWETLAFANARSRAEGLAECYELGACTGVLGGGCAPDETTCRGFSCAGDPGPGYDCEGYRLPTETEWERMARAGTTTPFLTTSGLLTSGWSATPLDPELDEIAWYEGNSAVTYPGGVPCALGSCGTHPVALKAPNAWGLYDITGNLWERVYDWAAYYPEPGTVVTDYSGPPEGTQHRVRGGVFLAYGQYMRVAYRTGPVPDLRSFTQGFRLVRTFIP